MRSQLSRVGIALAAMALALAVAPAAQAAPAPADTQVVRAGLTLTPTVTQVGDTVTVVGTATNTSATPANGALGIDNYGDIHTTSVSGVHCAPRNLVRLIYCGLSNLPAGATASITVTIVPSATGSFDFRTYARGTDDTYAYGTLTVN